MPYFFLTPGVRQKTVRQMSTMDNPGTLPIFSIAMSVPELERFFYCANFSCTKGHAKQYPRMHLFRITLSMINKCMGIRVFLGISLSKLHCGNIVNMPYYPSFINQQWLRTIIHLILSFQT